jgi:CRP/FNR family cyclic AMP-dependent transcriptional regulator
MTRKKKRPAKSQELPAETDKGRTIAFAENDVIFAQGDMANAIFHVQHGKVKVTVVSQGGK